MCSIQPWRSVSSISRRASTRTTRSGTSTSSPRRAKAYRGVPSRLMALYIAGRLRISPARAGSAASIAARVGMFSPRATRGPWHPECPWPCRRPPPPRIPSACPPGNQKAARPCHHHGQHAGGLRVQGARVAGLFPSAQAAQGGHHRGGGHARGLEYIDKSVHRGRSLLHNFRQRPFPCGRAPSSTACSRGISRVQPAAMA